jgi:LysM domain
MSPVHHKPKPHPKKKVASANVKRKHKPLTAAQQAVKEIYPHERSPYKAIPQSKRGPGKLTGGHTITIQAWTVQLSVTCLLGADGGKLTGGFGKWTEIAVPRSDPLTEWTGRALFAMDLDLMVDGWHRQASVEQALAKLEAMAQRIPASLTPPPLRLYGAVPKPGLKWVISGIDYGDCLRSVRTGQRLRQELTLHLLEYREETTLQKLPRATATSKPPRKYKVKKGDDLKKIAARLLGKSSAWEDIVKLNKGLRGWKLPAKWVGKTILVPQRGDKPKHDRNDPKPKSNKHSK